MPFKIDFVDGHPVTWKLTETSAEPTPDTAYRPRIYADIRDGNHTARIDLLDALHSDPKVTALSWEHWYTALGNDTRDRVLRIELERTDEITTLAREIRTLHELGTYAPGTYQLYNVDFTPQFRYCLDTNTDPTPSRSLRPLSLSLPEHAIANNDLTALHINDTKLTGDTPTILHTITDQLHTTDPDLLILNTTQLIPLLHQAATEHAIDEFHLGRRPGWKQLAGESTFESYGQIGYSPARYDIPGRAIIDRSNSFIHNHTGRYGLIDLVGRSHKPIQEAAWASIGALLTAIQIRTALDRDVLIPWNKSDPEQFKTIETLHAADRGGLTFEPQVGLHTDVYGLDFSSLYPNIMIEYNVSPETTRCPCHETRADVPELGYAICDNRGFIADVLEPIVIDRETMKRELEETTDPDVHERLEQQVEALKWILVTCFGYQGYKNSKFGRIEAHEAINAYARHILLDAKDIFEANGWEVVHGIVDSVWVTPIANEPQQPLEAVATEITKQVRVPLEIEHKYDWVCFVPRRESTTGALTKYFGKIAESNKYKIRGIELRQHSTPAFVSEAQRTYLDVLDQHRRAAAVCDRFHRDLVALRERDVSPTELVIRKRVSKPLEAYSQATHTVSALQRYRRHGIEKSPGQPVRYVVVDDSARVAERVRLPFEEIPSVDTDFYGTELLRACESIVSPLGWHRDDIKQYLRDETTMRLTAFSS